RCTAGDLRDHRRERLDERVHRVRAHRVAGVEEDVDDHHRLAAARANEAHLDVPRSGAAPAETRRQLLRGGEEAGACRTDALDRRARIGHVDELDLPDHRARIRLREEAAAGARDERRVRGGRDHGRLLDDHRDHVVAIVHPEVERHPERQGERPDRVLDHDVRDVERERIRRVQRLDLRPAQPERLGDLPPSLLHRQPVEPPDARIHPSSLHAPPPARTHSRSWFPRTTGTRRSASTSRAPVSTMAVRSPAVSRAMNSPAAVRPPCRYARKTGNATPTARAPSAIAFAASSPVRMPPLAIGSSPRPRSPSSDAAVGMPQSANSAPSSRSGAPARSASTFTHDVPPAPDTSTVRTPADARRSPTRRETPHPVSFTTTGKPSSRTRRAIVSTPPRKSRSPPGWMSSCAGFRWTQSA